MCSLRIEEGTGVCGNYSLCGVTMLLVSVSVSISVSVCLSVCLTSVNRRMDEWVTLSRVAVQKGAQKDSPKETVGFPEMSGDGPERKLTRNQKRKHDEINHVQKVCMCMCVGGCGCECACVGGWVWVSVCVCVGGCLHVWCVLPPSIVYPSPLHRVWRRWTQPLQLWRENMKLSPKSSTLTRCRLASKLKRWPHMVHGRG